MFFNKIGFKICICLMLPILLLTFCPVSSLEASGAAYYVAPDGSDENEGSLSAPFATISQAARVMQAGDTCYLRGGIYRETVTVSGKSDLTFRAYGNETVSISGGSLITGWTKYEGNIYVANTDINMSEGRGNMLFASGALGVEARWPNAAVSQWLDRSSYAYADGPERWQVAGQEDVRYITDATIAEQFPGLDLTGAMVWCVAGDGYWSYMAAVTSHETTNGTLHLDANAFHSGYNAVKNNMYYITRHLALLDADNEWFLDTENGKIYYQTPGGVDPNTMEIELRAREYAIHVTNSSRINFYGINVYGGLVNIGSGTTDCGYYDAKLTALDCKMPGSAADSSNRGYGRGDSRGLVLAGSGNTLSRCEVQNMFGEGVTLQGSENTVINNYIHDINFEHTYSDGIYIQGSRHLVTHNTVERTGRGTVGGQFDSCVISYNVLSDASRLSSDTGIVYFNAHDYKNSELHHNIIRGNDLSGDVNLQLGLYLDSFTSSLLIYNNLIYDTETETPNRNARSLCLNPNSYGNLFVNNTFVNSYPAKNWEGYDLSGTVFINNLFRSSAFTKEAPGAEYGVLYTHNLEGECIVNAQSDKVIDSYAPKDYWQDAAHSDYTLAAGSEAIDAGVFVAGINGGYTGAAPDCGAFEFGKEPWTAGHDFSADFDDTFTLNTKIPFRNLVENKGFESSLTSDWTTVGNPQVFESDSWATYGAYVKDGRKSLLLAADSDSLTQTVTGLKPYTHYSIGMFGFLGGSLTRYGNQSKVSLNTLRGHGFSVDFGSGWYDSIILRLQNLVDESTAKANPNLRIEVRIGSENGETVAVFPLSNSTDGLVRWEWKQAALSGSISGTQDVYLCPLGADENVYQSLYFAGFHFAASKAGDKLQLTTTSSEMTTQLDISAPFFERPMPTASIMTGADGTLTFSVSKIGNTLSGYADFVSLCEAPAALTGEMSNMTVESITVSDEAGRPRYGIAKGGLHTVTVTLANHTSETAEYQLRLLAYDGDTFVAASSAADIQIGGNQRSEAICSLSAPLSDAARLVLVVSDLAGHTMETELTDDVLESGYTSDGVFVKSVSVRGESGQLLEQAKAGSMAIFEITLKNRQAESQPIFGIMAVYDASGRLCDMIKMSYVLPGETAGTFGLGTVLPDDARRAKLFAWEKSSSLIPVIQNEVFEIAAPAEE